MFSNTLRDYKALCGPARLYATLSVLSLLAMVFQNLTNTRKYCLGRYSCNLPFSNIFVFLGKASYMLIWTIILQSLCKTGYSRLSWYFVLFPFIMMFIILGLFMFSMMAKSM